jgi:predicted short-subunit dehydrogenase-like oxidoreductase (DUF2520 family)
MKSRPSIAIVGPGSLGESLAVALRHAGYSISEIVYRSNKQRASRVARRAVAAAVQFEQASLGADLIWICVSDRDIAATAAVLSGRANWRGKIAFHASGALPADELAPLKKAGASVGSVHPMMSFVRGSEIDFKDVTFALEGDRRAMRLAKRIARDLGGSSFHLSKADKPLYHALGAFSSPLVLAQLTAAERIGRELGLPPRQTRKLIAPILLMTVSNYLKRGPAGAFSGPILRGDVETVRRNLQALRRVKGAADIYRALARVAVEDLEVKNRSALNRLLQR